MFFPSLLRVLRRCSRGTPHLHGDGANSRFPRLFKSDQSCTKSRLSSSLSFITLKSTATSKIPVLPSGDYWSPFQLSSCHLPSSFTFFLVSWGIAAHITGRNPHLLMPSQGGRGATLAISKNPEARKGKLPSWVPLLPVTHTCAVVHVFACVVPSTASPSSRGGLVAFFVQCFVAVRSGSRCDGGDARIAAASQSQLLAFGPK